MALDFQDYEQPARRERQSAKIGTIFRRVYHIPVGADSDLIPSRGTVVALRDVTLDDSDLLKPRVLNDPRRRKTQDGRSGQMVEEVSMTFIMPEAYS